jgi:hypothetical protein
MAVALIRTWGGTQYPWGYQVRFDLTDGNRVFRKLPIQGSRGAAMRACLESR